MISYLEDIAGNPKVKLILKKIIGSNNIPHAILFTGAEGVGKENAAISFAKELNFSVSGKENSSRILPAIERFSEPYIKYIFPLPRGKNETDQHDPYERLSQDEIELVRDELLKKSQNHYYRIQIPRANLIKINSIRDIKKFLSLSFDDIPYRVVLISQAHLMNEEAQNALLKNLEEPPSGVIFILSTHALEKLKKTIISRCWTINFQPLEAEEVVSVLTGRFNVEEGLARKAATFSGGSVTDAFVLIENDIEEMLGKTVRILRNSFAGRYQSAFVEFEDALSENNHVRLKLIIKLLIIWLTDLQRLRLDRTEKIFFSDYIETLEKFNSKFNDVPVKEIIYKLDNISTYLRNNINPNVAVSNLVFQLSSLIPR